MSYHVKTNNFEGPFDILLYLVSRQRVDIGTIAVAEIADQYLEEIAKLESLGFGGMPVCLAKTQYSFSDDATKLGAPSGFRVKVRDIKVSAGAGFVVALTGDIMTMPGLGKAPAAHKIDVDETGKITGLF